VRWPIPVAVCSVVLALGSMTPASADGVQGKGLHAEAAFDARALGDGRRKIQVLDQVCVGPDRQRGCEPIKPALRRAITKASSHRITWVDRPTPHRGTFWVLAPVRFGRHSAKVRWAWRSLHEYGCSGGGRFTYERQRGGWKLVLGLQYEGCPAGAGSG